MKLIHRLHELFAAAGISPKVADPFIGAIALIAFNLVVYGTFDVDGLRLAAGLLILGALGVAAPPAPGVKQRELARTR